MLERVKMPNSLPGEKLSSFYGLNFNNSELIDKPNDVHSERFYDICQDMHRSSSAEFLLLTISPGF